MSFCICIISLADGVIYLSLTSRSNKDQICNESLIRLDGGLTKPKGRSIRRTMVIHSAKRNSTTSESGCRDLIIERSSGKSSLRRSVLVSSILLLSRRKMEPVWKRTEEGTTSVINYRGRGYDVILTLAPVVVIMYTIVAVNTNP